MQFLNKGFIIKGQKNNNPVVVVYNVWVEFL